MSTPVAALEEREEREEREEGGGGGAVWRALQEALRGGIVGNAFVVWVVFVAVFILYCFVFDSVQNVVWLASRFQLFCG
jgi:hypothetical protein